MSSTPFFTAAIISFNRATMVRDAIESALHQNFRDYELLVVDDASTDDSASVLREYETRATVIVREQNGGEMAARNTAMKAARGEYMCFLDSDDLWFPWTLETFAEAIRRHGRPTVVGGNLFRFRDQSLVNQVAQERFADTARDCYFSSDHYLGVMSAAIHREAIENVGGFVDKRLNCLDSDLLFRIGDMPGFVKVESPFTLAFRQHEGIMANTNMSYGGASFLIESEADGKYPGGNAMRLDRLRHISRRARNVIRQCIRGDDSAKALDLYKRTFRWNISLRRWGFLGAIPLMVLSAQFRRWRDRGRNEP